MVIIFNKKTIALALFIPIIIIAIISAAPNHHTGSILVTINPLTTASNYIVIKGTLPSTLLKEWDLDLLLDVTGGEFVGDAKIGRESISSTTSYQYEFLSSNYKTTRTQIKVESMLLWPSLVNPTERRFTIKCRVKNLLATGFKIEPTSFFGRGQVKETFIPVVSNMALPLAMMRTDWTKTNPKNSLADVESPLDFRLFDINTPSLSSNGTSLHLSDQLQLPSFKTFITKSEEINCTINNEDIKATSTESVLTLKIKSWEGLTNARIQCDPATIMVNFDYDVSDKFWLLSTTDSETSTDVFQADLFEPHNFEVGWVEPLLWGVIAAAAFLTVAGIIYAILRLAKIGPFRPIASDQYSTDLLVNNDENQHQQF